MNAQEWLNEATFDMPRSVRERVKAETLEHLQDSGVQDNAEVLSVLGSPQKVNRELRRLYLTESKLNRLKSKVPSSGLSVGEWVSLFYWAVMIISSFFNADGPIPHALWAQILLYGSLMALVLMMRHLPPIRRSIWSLFSVFSLNGVSLFHFFFQVVHGFELASALVCEFFVVALWDTWRQDMRIGRTLKLESAASAQN